MLFVLARRLDVTFANTPFQISFEGIQRDGPSPSQLCLFSGGVDSFAGLLLAGARAETEAVFCAHRDQTRLIGIVRQIEDRLRARGIRTESVPVPPMGARGYVQLRGFLYALAAGLRMVITGARRLVVTECGPTMFQPQFSPLDSVTMTTHPVVMTHALRALNTIVGGSVSIS